MSKTNTSPLTCSTPELCRVNPETGVCMGCGQRIAAPKCHDKDDKMADHILAEKGIPQPTSVAPSTDYQGNDDSQT